MRREWAPRRPCRQVHYLHGGQRSRRNPGLRHGGRGIDGPYAAPGDAVSTRTTESTRKRRHRASGFRWTWKLELDLEEAGKTDDLSHTVNYAHLYRTVKEVMDGTPRNLLEALAENIAALSLARFPIQAVRVKVTKTNPPIKGSIMSGASVEIYRTRA